MFAFAISEWERVARNSPRYRLRTLGAAPIQGGPHASPHPITARVTAHAHRLDVGDTFTTFTTSEPRQRGTSRPGEVAAALAPAGDRGPSRASRRPRRDRPRLTGAAHAVGPAAHGRGTRRTLRVRDASGPAAATELLPGRWPGLRARDLMARCREGGHGLRHGGAGERGSLDPLVHAPARRAPPGSAPSDGSD
ncbi:hypothetical protein ACN20G_31655 (plasmid) [Streptomyces sp. BI20]|uniref:hypothetical protein n=1 Tax=Streptomyces sp. BI20 TaxID=3403460 RepID=UPI003C770352